MATVTTQFQVTGKFATNLVFGTGVSGLIPYYTGLSSVTTQTGFGWDTSTLRVLNAIQLNSVAAAAQTAEIYLGSSTSKLCISGDSGTGNGAEIRLHGGSHGSLPTTFQVAFAGSIGINADANARCVFGISAGTQVHGFNGGLSTTKYIQITANEDPGAPTDGIRISSKECAVGNAANTIHLRTERAVAADVAVASTHSINIFVNNTEYKLALTTA